MTLPGQLDHYRSAVELFSLNARYEANEVKQSLVTPDVFT